MPMILVAIPGVEPVRNRHAFRPGFTTDLGHGRFEVTELHVPGELTKNDEDFTLPLVYRDGKPMFDFVTDLKKSVRQPHEPIFNTTDFRSQWRQVCAKLGLGIYIPETQVYRGLRPHDFMISVAPHAAT